jgi:hypothetical protein
VVYENSLVIPAGASYSCNKKDGKKILKSTFNIVDDKCVDPGDGSGEFDTKVGCETQRNLRKLKYTCKDGTCVQDNNGEYANYVTCKASSVNNDGKCKSKEKEREQKQEENESGVAPAQTKDYLVYFLKEKTNEGLDDGQLSRMQPQTKLGDYIWGRKNEENEAVLYKIDTDNIVYKKTVPIDEYVPDNIDKIKSSNGWVKLAEKTTSEGLERIIKKIISTEMKLGNRRRIFEEKDEKFGEEKFEHWKKTFEFSSQDPETKDWKRIEKETIESKQVDIEKWVEHYLKSNDEDDAFVRAVIHVFKMDKNEKNHVKKVAFNKGLAHLSENFEVGGLLRVLSVIRESKELEIWSVKYYADGNWELVKGSFTDDELKNVGKTVKDREKKDEERKKPVEGLKKKELTGIQLLNQDEKEGLVELPHK